MKTENPRQIALQILNRFYQNNIFVENIINDFFVQKSNVIKPIDKPFITELVYGVIRWQIKIDYILSLYLAKNISHLKIEVLNILRLGFYQLLFLDKVPNFAVVNEMVNLSKNYKLKKFSGLINAVLRAAISTPKEINIDKKDVLNFLSIHYSHPHWLVERMISQFGVDETKLIIDSNNLRSKTTVRVNQKKATVKEIEDFFNENRVIFAKNNLYPNCLTIDKTPINIVSSEVFRSGKITIQDVSAMLCATLTQPTMDSLVFDLCAAPGGKSCYIAELMEQQNNFNLVSGKIIANDLYPKKIQLIKENAKRLNYSNFEYVHSDALEFAYNQDADIVIIDAPCSGFGTISKNPDIKYLRKKTDLKDLVQLQRKLLLKASNLVKVGGALIYSTCSIDKEENVNNIKWFLQNNINFSIDSADKYINSAYCEGGFVQCFPHKNNILDINKLQRTDGAFAVRLIKH